MSGPDYGLENARRSSPTAKNTALTTNVQESKSQEFKSKDADAGKDSVKNTAAMPKKDIPISGTTPSSRSQAIFSQLLAMSFTS